MSKLREAQTGFTFDDFILAPVYSQVKSRKYPDISVDLPGFKYNLPIVSSPMNTVTEADMLVTMWQLGGVGILHRYMSIKSQLEQVELAAARLEDAGATEVRGAANPPFYVAVGANGDSEERIQVLRDAGVTGFCVDVANGHNELSVLAVQALRRLVPNAKIMAGNVCTFDGAYRLAEAGANSIRVGIGPGCFAAGTRILMSNGTYKNIEDIRPGQRVINKDGKAVTVKNAWCTGHRKVMSYRHTQFYKPTNCTSDHKHFIVDISDKNKKYLRNNGGYAGACKNSRFVWKEIGDVSNAIFSLPNKIEFEINDDFIINLQKRSSGNNKLNIKYSTDTVLKPSYDVGYIFGTFLGDGNAHCTDTNNSKKGSVVWTFGKDEMAYAKKLKMSIQKVIGKDAIINDKNNILLVNLYYKPLADFLNTFMKKEKKHLPSTLIVRNNKYLQGLYDGLMDSDGHNCYSDTGFTNTSEKLMELFSLLRYLVYGTFPNMYPKSKSIGNLKNCNENNLKQSYRAQILKRAKSRTYNTMQLVKTLDIGYEGEKEVPVYDIEVDCPTHSFIANNAIVHNSMCTTRLITGHGLPQLSAIEDCARIKEAHFNGYTTDSVSEKNPTKVLVPARTKAFPDVAIIADGGIRRSGDIVKALAAGADAVMLGSLLAGTKETPGDILEEDGRLFKYYHGMASDEGRAKYKGQTSGVPSEGISTKLPYTGKTAQKVVNNLCDSVKVGLSFSNALSVKELQQNAQWVRVTGAGFIEGTPHGK